MGIQRSALHVFAAAFIAATGTAAFAQGQGQGQGQIQAPGQTREQVRGYQLETRTLGGAGGRLTGPNTGAPRDIALRYLEEQKQELGFTGADLKDVVVTSELVGEHSGVTQVYLQQRFRGIPVNGAVANVNIAADGSVISVGVSFICDLTPAIRSSSGGRTPSDAALAAALDAKLAPTQPFTVIESRGGARQETILSDGGVASGRVTASLVYQAVGPREVRLGWLVDLEAAAGGHWLIVVDAGTGEVIHSFDLVRSRSLAAALRDRRP